MSKIMDHYIDRLMLIEELHRLGQDFIDAEVDNKVMAGLSSALRHVKSFPAADVEKVSRWIPVTPETMPPEDENGESKNLILRILRHGEPVLYAGFTAEGKWHTEMYMGNGKLPEGCVVTHWMYADDLAEVQ